VLASRAGFVQQGASRSPSSVKGIMPPVVVIVGRPNVGKSTLFNRLTGKRSALVSDVPGLTRDWREGEADLAGHTLTLIDTAGLEEAAAGSIAARMRRQSEAAISRADLILFVLDAREGVVPADAAFARIVRAAGRPVIVVANKSEGRAGAEGFYEAFQLGFGEAVAVSAEHGEGIGELMETMRAALGLAPARKRRREDADEASEPGEGAAPQRPLRIAIVGRPNVGKSTLVNALLGTERMITGPEPGLTRDAVASNFQWQGRTVRLFDTAGLRRKARISEAAEKLAASDAIRAIRFAEVVVVLIDAQNPFEHQDLTIAALAEEEGRAVVLAINKWDLVADKQAKLAELRATAAERLAQLPGVPLVAVSALAGRGLDRLMHAAFASYEAWNRRVATRELNRWLADALSRHAPPAAKGRRIRIRFMTQVSARPPTFVAFCSQPAALPGSYVKYLTNSLRESFDLAGVPIRFKLRKGENPYAPD
jgi:GTP-binding protein